MSFKTEAEAKAYYKTHKEDFRRRREAWKLKDPEGFKIVQERATKKFDKSPKGIWHILKANSLKREQDFLLLQEEFITWYVSKEKKCFYCGISQTDWDDRLEIERLDNNKGYSLSNIELACADCNGVKGNILTEEEMGIVGDLVMRKRWQPKLSIVVPIHDMEHGAFFLWRLVQSLMMQSFKDYELVITQEGLMAKNTNAGITRARGELVKILYLDDYFAHPDALKNIVEAFKPEDMWLATGCVHQTTDGDLYEDPHSPHFPEYTQNLKSGNNRIGSPSVITLRNKGHLLFDEQMSFLLDCDLYERYYTTYGAPRLLNDLNVVIGLHKGQVSQTMSVKEKQAEFIYLNEKNG